MAGSEAADVIRTFSPGGIFLVHIFENQTVKKVFKKPMFAILDNSQDFGTRKFFQEKNSVEILCALFYCYPTTFPVVCAC